MKQPVNYLYCNRERGFTNGGSAEPLSFSGALAHNKRPIEEEARTQKDFMLRFLISLLLGLAAGALIGLYLGWVQFPVQYVDSPAQNLNQRYKDEYTVMVAGGYLNDGDVNGAVERLRLLGVENIPSYVQEVTERYISNSRNVDDIRSLVALSESLGRLTPIMEPYRRVGAS
jgi:hypothetical protein